MPTGSSAITLATTAKLEQEKFWWRTLQNGNRNSDNKRSGYLRKKPILKTCYSFNTSTQEVCAPALHQDTALLAKWLLVAFFFFFSLSEIKGFLPIRLAFPAEGSADVATLCCFSEHHLCTTFAMSTVPETSLKQVQHAEAQRKDYSRVLYHRELPPGLSPENKNVSQTI